VLMNGTATDATWQSYLCRPAVLRWRQTLARPDLCAVSRFGFAVGNKGVHRGLMFHARKMGQPRSRILWRLSP
jgi:hypothetical protein